MDHLYEVTMEYRVLNEVPTIRQAGVPRFPSNNVIWDFAT